MAAIKGDKLGWNRALHTDADAVDAEARIERGMFADTSRTLRIGFDREFTIIIDTERGTKCRDDPFK